MLSTETKISENRIAGGTVLPREIARAAFPLTRYRFEWRTINPLLVSSR